MWGYTGGMDEEGGHTGMVNENTLVVKGREGTGVVSRRHTRDTLEWEGTAHWRDECGGRAHWYS